MAGRIYTEWMDLEIAHGPCTTSIHTDGIQFVCVCVCASLEHHYWISSISAMVFSVLLVSLCVSSLLSIESDSGRRQVLPTERRRKFFPLFSSLFLWLFIIIFFRPLWCVDVENLIRIRYHHHHQLEIHRRNDRCRSTASFDEPPPASDSRPSIFYLHFFSFWSAKNKRITNELRAVEGYLGGLKLKKPQFGAVVSYQSVYVSYFNLFIVGNN